MSDSKSAQNVCVQESADVLDEQDYEALETALTQFGRGRAFLDEYLRRNGRTPAGQVQEKALPEGSDTARILGAIADLHTAFSDFQQNASQDSVRMGIVEMAKAIAKTRSEIASMRTEGSYDQLTVASEEMDAIVHSTEKATTDILQSAERIQEVAWQLREAGAEEATCEIIDNCATDIYMACSFQDLTGQRTTKVIRVLQYLEARIDSMMEIWGVEAEGAQAAEAGAAGDLASPFADDRPDAHLLNGPQAEGVALGQDNIDDLLGDDGFDAIPAADGLVAEAGDMGQDNIDALMSGFDGAPELEAEVIVEEFVAEEVSAMALPVAEAAPAAPAAVEPAVAAAEPVAAAMDDADLEFIDDDEEVIDEAKLKALFG